MAEEPLSRQRPTRLVAIGLGRQDSKSVRIGGKHQVDDIPDCGGPSGSSSSDPAVVLSVADLEKEVAVSIGACHHRIALLPPCAAPAAAALPDDDDDDDDWEDRHHEAPSPPEEPDVDERIMEALGSAGMFVGGGRSSYDPHRHGGLGMGNTMGKRSAPGMLACEMGPPPKLPKLPKLPKPLTAKPPPPKPPPPKPPPPKQPSETELATSAAAAAREAKRLKKVEEENRKIKEAVTKWFELLLKTLEAQKRREESEHSKMLAELAKREAEIEAARKQLGQAVSMSSALRLDLNRRDVQIREQQIQLQQQAATIAQLRAELGAIVPSTVVNGRNSGMLGQQGALHTPLVHSQDASPRTPRTGQPMSTPSRPPSRPPHGRASLEPDILGGLALPIGYIAE